MVRADRIAIVTLVWLLTAHAAVRGDAIQWSFESSHSPAAILSNNGDSEVTIHTTGWESMQGSSDIIAATLRTVSSASPAHPNKFTDQPYSVTLTIKDAASGVQGSVTFTGELSGSLSSNSSILTNTWTGHTTEQLHLGMHVYVISVESFAPPGPPSSGLPGVIDFHVAVSHNPEPSSLLLGALGIPGLVWLRRRFLRFL